MAIDPAVEPPDDDPIADAEYLLHFKMRGGRTGEEIPACVKHRLPANMTRPVRCRAGGVKDAVVGDQISQGVEIPAVERIMEPLYDLASLIVHRNDLPLCHASPRYR